MILFQIGDKVFYPRHGAGVIRGIEKKEVLGKIHNYYLISMPNINMDIMIPVDRANKIGLRAIVNDHELSHVLNEIRSMKADNELPWKERLKQNSDKLKTGIITDTAEIFKELYSLNKEKPLNAMEKQILSDAHKYLVSEICLIKDISESEAENLLIS